MEICKGLNNFRKPPNGCVLSVGNFDGVHLGHQAIFRRGKELAREKSLPLVAMTFDPRPVKTLCPEKAPGLLSPLAMKAKLIADQGVDILVVIPATGDLLALSPRQFVEQILVDRFAVACMVEGNTFNFGKGGKGTISDLRQLSRDFAFDLEVVDSYKVNLTGKGLVAINSTLVRKYFAASEFELAKQCLGRYLALGGQLVSGRGKGRELGFPTANLQRYSVEQLVPGDGVFAGFAKLGRSLDDVWDCNKLHQAAISIGRCETFPDGAWQIEAYLLDYDNKADNMYHEHMLLMPIARIRDQKPFDSLDALTAAIEADCRKIQNILKT